MKCLRDGKFLLTSIFASFLHYFLFFTELRITIEEQFLYRQIFYLL